MPEEQLLTSKVVEVPILWYARMHIIPTNVDGERRVQVFLDGKLQFEEVGEAREAMNSAVNYVAKNFCIIPRKEAEKWAKRSGE